MKRTGTKPNATKSGARQAATKKSGKASPRTAKRSKAAAAASAAAPRRKAAATGGNASDSKHAKSTVRPSAKERLSALDAAFLVLQAAKQPMNCKALIGAMATQKLWLSPNGKTPQATLSAAIQREIKTKGTASRFVKTGPGLYAGRAGGGHAKG